MEGRVFRFQNYTKKYEETCDFYERTLKLPIITKRETAYEDRVRVYKLGSGQIEVIYLPDDMDAPVSNGWTLQVEVENADKVFEEAQRNGNIIGREPCDQFWGHRNCKLIDPTGFELTFYHNISKEEELHD
jgi:uncharacterized glyoxalase superfamily protein PhnB